MAIITKRQLNRLRVEAIKAARKRSKEEREALDKELLDRAAKEALEKPRDSAWWDKRCFTTHGVTFEWVPNSDDMRAESNFNVARELIRQAAGPRADEHVIDGGASHWAYGHIRHLFVQVHTKTGAYTEAFKEAVRLAEATKSDPILDEGDYHEREFKLHEDLTDRALDHVRRDYPDDSEQDEAEIYLLIDFSDNTEYPDVDWDWMKKAYAEARSEYFEKRARDWLPYVPSDAPYIHPDQLTLPI